MGEGAGNYTKTPSISVCEGRNWRREDYKTRSEQCLRGYKSQQPVSQKEKRKMKTEAETKKSKEENQHKTGGKAEAKVDPDFAIIATKLVTTTPPHAPNQENLVLQIREGVTHHTQEGPHLREKEEKQTRVQTHSE